MAQETARELHSLELLHAGDVIDLPGGLADIPLLEEYIAAHLRPDMTPDEEHIWGGRAAVADWLRPGIGKLTSLRAVALADPAGDLLHPAERKLRFQTKTRGEFSTVGPQLRIDDSRSVVGFELQADISVGSSSKISSFTARIIYRPVHLTRNQKYHAYLRQGNIAEEHLGELLVPSPSSLGKPILRYVTYPVVDTRVLEQARAESADIGHRVLAYYLSHPVRG